ncbi:hypothetical protein V8C86DRAFT_3023830 [Haematococcus lacustris]
MDRRPLRFWQCSWLLPPAPCATVQPFNDWWRAELERTGHRPGSLDIQAWHQGHAQTLWPGCAPSLHETKVHAKCMRSLLPQRQYFRSYRAKKRTGCWLPVGCDDEDVPADPQDSLTKPGAEPAPAPYHTYSDTPTMQVQLLRDFLLMQAKYARMLQQQQAMGEVFSQLQGGPDAAGGGALEPGSGSLPSLTATLHAFMPMHMAHMAHMAGMEYCLSKPPPHGLYVPTLTPARANGFGLGVKRTRPRCQPLPPCSPGLLTLTPPGGDQAKLQGLVACLVAVWQVAE